MSTTTIMITHYVVITTLGGLCSATSFYIYIHFFLSNFFLLFSAFLRSRTRRTRISIDFPLFSGCSKYLPLVSKGGRLPPFHAPSSATHEIIHNFTNIFYFYFEVSLIIFNNFTKILLFFYFVGRVAWYLTSSSCNLGIK